MALSDLVGNYFWDNSDPKGEKSGYILDTDKRHEFLIEFQKFVKPYCTKNTVIAARHLGLFKTGCGMTLIIIKGSIRKDCNLSLSELAKKFGQDNNIPVYISGNDVFSNKYSQVYEDELVSRNVYSTRQIDAYMEVYGKPLYMKTDKILGTLSEYLDSCDDEYVSIFNYNYVGYVSGFNKQLLAALKTIGEDFDVIKYENAKITIQTDEYDLIKKLEYKYKDLERNQ